MNMDSFDMILTIAALVMGVMLLTGHADILMKGGNAAKGWSTPAGAYSITYKQRNATLKGQGYATPISYWMPFNGGIGFHDATWQAYFGGDRYTYAGSHGCINMPLDAAATLYSIIDTNVPIVCFY